MKQKIAIYPGTFDPITLGHVDIIRRGANLFDRVVIGVAESQRKNTVFDCQQRVAMCREALQSFDNVSVEALTGLTVDFAKEYDARYLLRGLRAVSDFDYELQIAAMNQQMDATIETVFLPASVQHAGVSSSIVREIMSLDKEKLKLFVPECVLKYLA
ncbi:MAG: pantetheine-phosphate adenylyltransferase [Gammaproteobacteria bacterium]|nr:pantetheine-phosphate adenylyltransferase [Gammaproteobacteria bacterium]MCH9744078.1 pantetheine-phosphate adenylyltransferase [Gammaproteobacteria bacterium]